MILWIAVNSKTFCESFSDSIQIRLTKLDQNTAPLSTSDFSSFFRNLDQPTEFKNCQKIQNFADMKLEISNEVSGQFSISHQNKDLTESEYPLPCDQKELVSALSFKKKPRGRFPASSSSKVRPHVYLILKAR